MEVIREANENEMLLEFLKEEYTSTRYNEKLTDLLNELNLSIELIRAGDIVNDKENTQRKALMKKYRGYDDEDMFENFPKIIKWMYGKFKRDELKNIFYINYCYWNELSSYSGNCLEAAKNIRNGIEIYNVSNQAFFDGLEYLRSNKFPPIIVITCDENKYLIIEGHSRLTVYGLEPDFFENTFAYIGYCTREELLKYDGRSIF